MSGNVLPATLPPIVSGLPNWLAKASKTADSGFGGNTVAFWGDSTTSNALNMFGGGAQPVCAPTFGTCRFGMFHQKAGEALANTRILNFGNNGATLAVSLADTPMYGITRVLSASQQIQFPASAMPAAGDTVTIGTDVWTWIASGGTPSGLQVALGASLAASISNLATALSASASGQTAKNRYNGANTAFTDGSANLDIWSKVIGPGGGGQAVSCSTAGAVIYGTPVLAVPDLLVLCYGINDVRQGATSLAQMIALLTAAVNRVRAVLPITDIVLLGPNSFLTDDPGAYGRVTPIANAQSYSTLLYNAYAALKNIWPNVVVLQKQDVFGKTATSYAAQGSASGWMADQIHPSLPAQNQVCDWLAPLIGTQAPFNPQRAALARTVGAALGVMPYTLYPREVEDSGFYATIASGQWLTQGTVSSQDYVDIIFPGPRFKEVMAGDVVAMGRGGPVFQIPYSAQITNLNATTLRLANLGTGLLPAISGGTITILRHLFEFDATVQSYLQQKATYPYRRRFFVPAAGNGYLRLYPLGDNSDRAPDMVNLSSTTDVLVCPGIGAVTGFTFNPFTGTPNWQVNKSGTDFSSLLLKYVWVVSTVPRRDVIENAWEPMRLSIPGTLTAGPAKVMSIASRGAGTVNRIYALLGTAGTATTTVVLKVNGTQVVSFTFNTGQTQIGSITWATASYFSIVQGQSIEWDITAGAGAADLAVVFDVGG